MKPIKAWGVIGRALVAYGNGSQFQYPVFTTRREAVAWKRESYNAPSLKVIRVEIRQAKERNG